MKYVSKIQIILLVIPLLIGGLLYIPSRAVEEVEADAAINALNGDGVDFAAADAISKQKNNMQAVAPLGWAIYYTAVGMSIVKRNKKKESK